MVKNSDTTIALREQHLGKIYRLIEQFELISRIDLSKLSGYAPASITSLTRQLIESNLVIERTAQTPIVRGRPAVGLALSPFYWQFVCVTLSKQSIDIQLCELNGVIVAKQSFSVDAQALNNLDKFLLNAISDFLANHRTVLLKIMALSLLVIGQINAGRCTIVKLDDVELDLEVRSLLEQHFSYPIVISDYFASWVFTESAFGSAINSDNVIFLQLDHIINMSVLLKGEVLHNEKQQKMNIDRVCLPRISELSDYLSADLPAIEGQQLKHQVSYSAIYKLVDHLLPNELANDEEKIRFLCEQANNGVSEAITIIHFIADNISYILMNLVNIFSSEKVMVNSSLLQAKEIFLGRLKQKLNENLLLDDHHVDVITGHYISDQSAVANASIKQHLYDGSLIATIK